MASTKQRILILGVSGFIGKALYKEFCSLYKTYGTYRRANAFLEKNTHLFEYDIEEDDIYDLLNLLDQELILLGSTIKKHSNLSICTFTPQFF